MRWIVAIIFTVMWVVVLNAWVENFKPVHKLATKSMYWK